MQKLIAIFVFSAIAAMPSQAATNEQTANKSNASLTKPVQFEMIDGIYVGKAKPKNDASCPEMAIEIKTIGAFAAPFQRVTLKAVMFPVIEGDYCVARLDPKDMATIAAPNTSPNVRIAQLTAGTDKEKIVLGYDCAEKECRAFLLNR